MLVDDLAVAAWIPAQYRDVLAEAVAFEIDEVADYARAYWLGHHGPVAFPPNCAPLAPVSWFEWHRAVLLDGARAHGVLWVVEGDAHSGASWQAMGFADADVPADTRWALHGLVAVRDEKHTALLADRLRLFLAADGRVLRCDLSPLADADGIEQPNELAQQQYQISVLLVLTAICFAHCKGVTLTEHRQPRQQRRAAERSGRPPLVTYKTIDIAPVTRILQEDGHIERTGLKRALHVCRGHFAHYTEDRPLFGTYTGTFYRPLHVRGRPERGAVVKDYRILSPEVDP